MEISGKVIEVLAPKGGQSARGSWKKQDFVIETDETYPKKVCISNWNDKVDISSLKPGLEITASVGLESREYNGNWFTDVKIWKLSSKTDSISSAPQAGILPGNDVPPPPFEEPIRIQEDNDDIPF